MSSGSFRAPLLNRLAAYEISIPPLRERRDDLGWLLVRFLKEELERIGEASRLGPPESPGEAGLPASVVMRLAEHDWPGNIRQLRNVVRQLVIGSRGRARVEIGPAVERLLQGTETSSEPPLGEVGGAGEAGGAGEESAEKAAPSPALPRRKAAEVTEREVAEALRASRWELAAAELLRVSRPSLYLLLERYPRFRRAGDLQRRRDPPLPRGMRRGLGRRVERLEVSERALRRRMRELGLR